MYNNVALPIVTLFNLKYPTPGSDAVVEVL
jgi:hypothetical protein